MTRPPFVFTFFYGTFMSAAVLREYGIDCSETIPARIAGFELEIRPRVNLKQVPESFVYGGLALITHASIASLYDGLREDFGIVYEPYPVLAKGLDGARYPALCCIAEEIEPADPDPDYVRELVDCAGRIGAPQNYLDHIASFRAE